MPIDIAAEYGHPDIFKYLFDMEELETVEPKRDVSSLINAAVSRRENEVLTFLKSQKAYIEHRHLNTLHFACRQLHGHNMVSNLINDISIMYQDRKYGFSPLMVAVQHRRVQCVHQILSHKACTQKVIQLVSPITLRSVFHVCAEVNNNEITDRLCKTEYLSSLVIFAADNMGDTPLHICAKFGNAHMSKLLLAYINKQLPSKVVVPQQSLYRTATSLDLTNRFHSKVPNEKTNNVYQHRATDENVLRILKKKNKDRYTPLHLAIYNGNQGVAEEILNHCDSSVINECDDQKRTSLHLAAGKGDLLIRRKNVKIQI